MTSTSTNSTNPVPAADPTAQTPVLVTWTVATTTTYRTTTTLADLLEHAATEDVEAFERLRAEGSDLSKALAAVAMDDTGLQELEGEDAEELSYACTSRELVEARMVETPAAEAIQRP